MSVTRSTVNRGSITQDIDRAEKLREAIAELSEANRLAPVIVEGKRDALALRRVGLEGAIITLHSGKSLHEFCEGIRGRYRRVILLLDWDARGETLYKSLCINLRGLWEEFSPFRSTLKNLCQKDISDIEGIPKLLSRLEGGATAPSEHRSLAP